VRNNFGYLNFYFVFASRVSNTELAVIDEGKHVHGGASTVDGKRERPSVLYSEVAKDPIIWLVLITPLFADSGYQLFEQFGPIYLHKVMGMDLAETGSAAILPYIVCLVTAPSTTHSWAV